MNYVSLNEMASALVGDGKTRRYFVTIGYGWQYTYDADKGPDQDEPTQVKGAPKAVTIAVLDSREEAVELLDAIPIKTEEPTKYSITDVMIEDKTGVLIERRLTLDVHRNRYLIDRFD